MARPYLWDPWRTASVHPSRFAVVAGERSCTFAELVARAEEYGRGIAGLGVSEGELLATDIPSGPDLFALVLAALRGGYGLFPVARDMEAQARGSLLRASGAVLEITATARAGGAVPCVTGPDVTRAATGPERRGSRAGYLAFTTSGTTGLPTVVVRARPSYSYRGVAVLEEYCAGTDRGPHVMANPKFHLGTLGLGLYSLQAGSPLVIAEKWSPDHFCDLVDEYRADTAFLSPYQLADLVDAEVVPRHALKVLFHGGAPTPPDVKRRAIDQFGPVLHEFYGTSKGIACQISSQEWLASPGAAGRALPGVRVSVRSRGGEAEPGQIGRIHLRYRAFDTGAANPEYEDTGDLGYLDESGLLHVVGRAGTDELDRPALLEHLVRQQDGVTDVAVTTAPDDPDLVVCHLEYRDEKAVVPSAQIAEWGRGLGLGKVAVMAGPTGSLPRTASGKLSRVLLARRGTSSVPAPDGEQQQRNAPSEVGK